MELAVGVRLAALEGLAAVEKCSGSGGRDISELKHYNLGSQKAVSGYTEFSGRTHNGNPG